MLRHLFDQARRKEEGMLLQTNQSILKFKRLLRELEANGKLKDIYYRKDLIASGFLDGLNELEQSKYSAVQYSKQLSRQDIMDAEAVRSDEYKLHIYFYKNAIIRLFSVLDKLGYFLDGLMELNTASVKKRFSYYTVLRRLRQLGVHPELLKQLLQFKTGYQLVMQHLRTKRNLEVHHISAEILDDIKQISDTFIDHQQLEDIHQNMDELEQGYRMVCLSVHAAFEYTIRSIHQRMIQVR